MGLCTYPQRPEEGIGVLGVRVIRVAECHPNLYPQQQYPLPLKHWAISPATFNYFKIINWIPTWFQKAKGLGQPFVWVCPKLSQLGSNQRKSGWPRIVQLSGKWKQKAFIISSGVLCQPGQHRETQSQIKAKQRWALIRKFCILCLHR